MKKYIISVIGLMTIVNAEGIISDTFETEHPYTNNENITQDICVENGYTGPAKVTITGELENNYDFVTISDVNTRFTGVLDENIDVASECVTVHFTTDFSVVKDGITVHIEAEDNGSGNPCLTRVELEAMIEANEDVTDVNTSCITSMYRLFYNNKTFNQDISGWDVSNVISMRSMFNGASLFNQSLNSWDVSHVTKMANMFYKANSFNKALDNWNVSKVESMKLMFYKASSFNTNIKHWDINNVIPNYGHYGFATYSSLENKYNPFVRKALENILHYAENNNSNNVVIPTLEDYKDAGISSVNENNLEEVNTLIMHTDKDVINTAEQIDSLVEGINASLSGKMLIILVDLEDRPLLKEDEKYEYLFQRTTDFYIRSSLGTSVLTVANETYGNVNDGIIRVKLPSNYTFDDRENDDFYIKALDLADEYIDFSHFDLNKDGILDTSNELLITFVISTNGSGGVVSTAAGDVTYDNISFYKGLRYSRVGQRASTSDTFLYIFMHELGHLKYKLIDLYWNHISTYRKLEGLMIGQSNPQYLNAYSYNKLRWGVGEEIEEGSIELVDSLAPFYIKGPRVYRISTQDSKEHFLIQNVLGQLKITHISDVKYALAYENFKVIKNNEYILRYLSNEHNSVEIDKKITNIQKKSNFVITLDIVENNIDTIGLRRPLNLIFQKNIVIQNSGVYAYNLSLAALRGYEWKDISAEKYGLKIVKHTATGSEVLYENMNLDTCKVDTKLFINEKSTIEVVISAYKDAEWISKTYYFSKDPEKTLEEPQLGIEYNSEGRVTFKFLKNLKYYIFGDGHLLDTIDGNISTFTSDIDDISNYQIVAFDLNGNISPTLTIPNYEYHPNVGMLPIAGSKFSSSTVTFNWNDFVPGAHEYGKYKFVISNPKLLNGTIGICPSLNEAECTITGLPIDGSLLKAVLIDKINDKWYYFNYFSK